MYIWLYTIQSIPHRIPQGAPSSVKTTSLGHVIPPLQSQVTWFIKIYKKLSLLNQLASPVAVAINVPHFLLMTHLPNWTGTTLDTTVMIRVTMENHVHNTTNQNAALTYIHVTCNIYRIYVCIIHCTRYNV